MDKQEVGDAEEVVSEPLETTAEPTESESSARKMGWVPKEEFKGDPDKWRSAEEFVRFGENAVPILKDRLRKQEQDIARLNKTISSFAEHHSKVEQKAFERAIKELKERQLEAVESGNTDAFLKIDKDIAELKADVYTPPVEDSNPVFDKWVEKNDWFTNDKTMASYAESVGTHIKKINPGLVGMDFLDEVTKEVKEKYPSKFENPKRSAAPSVEGSTSTPSKGGKSYADLPKEARDACNEFVKDGVFKSKEAYVKAYFKGAE